MRTAQHTSSQVRGKLVPILLNTSIDAVHESAKLCLPLRCGQVVLERGLDTLGAARSVCQGHLGTIIGMEAFRQREAFAAYFTC